MSTKKKTLLIARSNDSIESAFYPSDSISQLFKIAKSQLAGRTRIVLYKKHK